MRKPVDVDEVARLFESIQLAFPHLTMRLDRQHPHVDLNMDIPSQPGLLFNVNINLQGDELHLDVGALWLEWFPCTDADVVARFREAVRGVLLGTFRIVEHLRGARAVRPSCRSRRATGGRGLGRPASSTFRSDPRARGCFRTRAVVMP